MPARITFELRGEPPPIPSSLAAAGTGINVNNPVQELAGLGTNVTCMKTMLHGTLLVAIASLIGCGYAAAAKAAGHWAVADPAQAIFKNYQDCKWERILPDLGESSPEICILHV